MCKNSNLYYFANEDMKTPLKNSTTKLQYYHAYLPGLHKQLKTHIAQLFQYFHYLVKTFGKTSQSSLTSIRVRKSGNQANMQRLPHFFLIAVVHNDAIIPRPVTQIESRFFGLFSTQSKAKVVTCECARVFFMYIVARILDQIQLWHFLLPYFPNQYPPLNNIPLAPLNSFPFF